MSESHSQAALDDLLAAIQSNSNTEQTDAFSSVSPVPSAQIRQFPAQVSHPVASNPLISGSRQIPARRQPSTQIPAAGAHVPSAQQVPGFHQGRPPLSSTSTKDNNLIELQNVLGIRPSSASSSTRQPNTATQQQMFTQQSVSGPAAARRLQLGGAYAAGGVNPNMTSGLSRQQLANAKAIQMQRAASAANARQSTPARQSASLQTSSSVQRTPEGLPTGVAAGRARSATATNTARNQAQRASAGSAVAAAVAAAAAAAAAQRQGAHQNPQPARDRTAGQNHSVTQEQIIVGHFCRHAIKTLARVMQNNPRAQEADRQLREHIKAVWTKWIRRVMTRPQLLESVANCVRKSCEAAAQIDVIREFKAWYEREYELQKRRTSMGDAKEQANRQPAQRRNSAQNQITAMRAQTVAQTAAAVRGSAAVRTAPGNRAMLTAKPEAQVVAGTGGKRLANKTIPGKQAGMGRGVAGKTLAGRGMGRGVAGKSLGGKSIPRQAGAGKIIDNSAGRGQLVPRAGVGRGTAGGKVPMLGRGAGVGKSPAIGRGSPIGQGATMVNMGITNEGVVGGKGLLSNKSPSASKTKTPRKATPKGPAKQTTKVSPKAVAARQKPPPANPAAFVAIQGGPGTVGSVVGKRPLDQGVAVPQRPLTKKTKTPPMVNKGPAARKKPPGLPGSPSAQKGKPPPARPEMFKGKPQLKRPGQPLPAGQVANTMGKGLLPGQVSASQPPMKKPRRADDGMDELSVVNNIVDIEDEEDKLGIDAGGDAPEVQEVFDYGADMLLAGPPLRNKMQTIVKRFGLDVNFGTDCMEMMSLAVRERLAEVFESLKGIASIRTGRDKEYWKIEPIGPNVHDRLVRMRQDEERTLEVAAETRVKRRKEQMEQEAKKLAGENASTDKKTKDTSAAAEAERKEKLALEKKRKEHSSQRDALSALVRNADARRKKPTTSKALAPLDQLGKKGLPPIPKMVGSGGAVSAGSSSKDRKMQDQPEKFGPLIKLGRANDPRNMQPQPAEQKQVVKRCLTLRDCLFLMEREPQTRKSSLVYKWYARLGTRDEK